MQAEIIRLQCCKYTSHMQKMRRAKIRSPHFSSRWFSVGQSKKSPSLQVPMDEPSKTSIFTFQNAMFFRFASIAQSAEHVGNSTNAGYPLMTSSLVAVKTIVSMPSMIFPHVAQHNLISSTLFSLPFVIAIRRRICQLCLLADFHASSFWIPYRDLAPCFPLNLLHST